MKISLPLAVAALALTGSAALAADPIPTAKCQPGTVADAPERCTVPYIPHPELQKLVV